MRENNDPPQVSDDSVAGGFGNGDESSGQDVDPNQEMPHVDSKEDMFVDASEELNFDTPTKEVATAADDDNGRLGDGYENEREVFAREIAVLQEQLKLLSGENDLLDQDGNTAVGSSVHEVASQVSKFLETVKEERVRHENTVRELQEIINRKDHEIEGLTARIAELSSSLDVASSPLSSVGEVDSQAQLETNKQIEAVADRILVPLSAVFGQEELQYASVAEKLTCVENRVSLLSAKYNDFLYGIDQLRKCFSRDGSDLSMQEDFSLVLGAACSELLELKQKEAVLFEKTSHLEDENRKLTEQVNKDRETIESMYAEFGKMKVELEQERARFANTKEKLSMAVTRGKALVQQRDALKQSVLENTMELEKRLTELQEKKNALETSELIKAQLEKSLADKTNELEKCLSELQNKSVSLEAYELAKRELEQSLAEKTKELEECLMKLQEMSSALDASELSKGELVKTESLIASYQEMLSQRSSVIENFEAILTEIDAPEEVQSVDIVGKVRWLAEDRKELSGISVEYNRLKDAIFSIDLPEEISKSNLEACFSWLKEAFFQAKGEVSMLQHQIERLSSSLSAEIQGKDNIQKELDDVSSRLKEMEENAHRVSLEKDQIARRLLDTSGLMAEGGDHHTSSVMDMLIDRSFKKIEEGIRNSSDNSYTNAELYEKIQSLLYVKDLELSLCEEIQGEEMLVKSLVSNLSNELRVASQDLASVKEEKITLERDLERSEEKSALLREKLSMAIKKGKGLVQDRENLKHQLDEKNSEIEKLKHELQQLGCTVDDYKNRVNSLSEDLQRIPELEGEVMAIKDERDQLERSLSQSNNILQRVTKSVDIITIPVELASEDPLEKINWLAGYFKEGQLAKIEAEEKLEKVKEEASILATKLEETHAALRSVEDALSTAEDNINRLSEENSRVQAAKENVELELQKAVDDASSLASKLEEALATRKSLEDALMRAERSISEIISEKEEAQSSGAVAEMELEKLREEVSIQTKKLTGAHGTIKSLENALSQVESSIELLSKQIDDDKVVRTNLENELKKLKDEAEFQSGKTADAYMTIESLEKALVKAENSISALQGEKLKAEVEISTLSSKLNACVEELSGLSGNSQNISSEIIGYLDHLQMLLRDNGPASRVDQFLERKFKSLRDMELIVKDIREQFAEKGLSAKGIDNATEDDSIVAQPLLNGLDDSVNAELENIQGNAADEAEISSWLRKIAEGFKLRNKILENNFESLSTSMDMLVATLLKNLTAAREDVENVFAHIESLKENMNSVEIINREQEKAISTLQDDVSALLSACGEAVRELRLEVKNNLQEMGNFPVLQFQEDKNGGEGESIEHLQGLDVSERIQRVKELSSATAKARTIIEWFDTTSNAAAVVIQDGENKLKEASTALEKVAEERELDQDKVLGLEANIESLEALRRDLKLQLQDFKAKEEKWLEKDAELSSLHDKLLAKEQEAEDTLISASDVRALFDKINGMEIPSAEPVKGVDPQNPYDVKKLFYIVDCVTEMQHQIDLLSYEKEELQSTLSTKAVEIQRLKEAAETQSTTKPELEKMKNEFSELTSGLEKLLRILAGNDSLGDPNSTGSLELLQALEKRATSLLLESESSKSKAQELGLKLVGSEKLVDELSLKVKALEDKLQSRTIQPDTIQERSIFEAPKVPSTSEISEIEDVGSLGKNSISPVPSAAQVRTIRKGSSDHLTVTIDSESERLMNHHETDEDKGHVFKSLNMSGLIPRQGKMIADRIDGIWVSGGRVLMSRPRARLGLISYCLLLHLWLLGSVL